MELKPVLLGAVAESRGRSVTVLTGSVTCAAACDWTSDYMYGKPSEVVSAKVESK